MQKFLKAGVLQEEGGGLQKIVIKNCLYKLNYCCFVPSVGFETPEITQTKAYYILRANVTINFQIIEACFRYILTGVQQRHCQLSWPCHLDLKNAVVFRPFHFYQEKMYNVAHAVLLRKGYSYLVFTQYFFYT